MIDLKTCLRPELVEAYQKRGVEIKQLKQRLKQYESEQSDDEKEKDFQKFLTMYGKKTNQKQAKALWFRLSKKKIAKIWVNLPLYVKEQPDKNFRVNPDKYLRHEKFDDVFETVQELNRPKGGAREINPMARRLDELAKIRDSKSNSEVHDLVARLKKQ